ncbi:hypothetical protein SRABI128_04204 [Microbacterium sp. Bi128]|nr:hypothetical protein SRABI128_04204 [Microbacterium sp. Bi128]
MPVFHEWSQLREKSKNARAPQYTPEAAVAFCRRGTGGGRGGLRLPCRSVSPGKHALGSAERRADAGSDTRLPPAHEAHPAGVRSGRGLHLQVDACRCQADYGPKQHKRNPGPELHEPERHHAGNPPGLPGHERRRLGLGHVVPDRRERKPDQLQGLGRDLLTRCRPPRRLRLRPAALERPDRLFLPQDQRRSGQGQVELRRTPVPGQHLRRQHRMVRFNPPHAGEPRQRLLHRNDVLRRCRAQRRRRRNRPGCRDRQGTGQHPR